MKRILSLLMLSSFSLGADVIPLPKQMEWKEGEFLLSAKTTIRHDKALGKEARLLAVDLAGVIGAEPGPVGEASGRLDSEIHLDLDPDLEVDAEGYQLKVAPDGVRIVGKDAAGAWYGTRSLIQMISPAEHAGPAIPAAEIVDEPRFGWRGMHLDVGRHFFPVEDIRGFIDWLAFHKLNVFHWHLTEDQGWRIEIRKYPRLTEVGGFRESTPPYGDRNGDDGERYGGFYTQEQIRGIVAYAAERHVTIVPEIDMPGHMSAAIAAYPELGNSDIEGYAPKVFSRWGVHPYTLAPTERVFDFVDDVLTEVCELFPSDYIHIGGDEAPKDQWEQSPRVRKLMKEKGLKDGHDVQSYFIRRVERILGEKGRKLIGWDEIREGGLAPTATVMSWRGEQGGIASAKEGHDVVMASNSHLYFDYYQYPGAVELAKGVEYEAIGGFLPLEKVYSYDPVPAALAENEAKHVIGVQGQLWTEYMKDWDKVEYMAFPRIAALAEIAWTPVARKDYQSFGKRLESVVKFYDAAGVNRAVPLPPVRRETRVGSTISSSLGAYGVNWPELAFDGRPETFFWADRALRENDHLTISFREPQSGKATVKTGGAASRNGDKLENGVLETSTDGETWVEIGVFKDGLASGGLPQGTRHLRLRVTGGQTNWLIVHEVEIE